MTGTDDVHRAAKTIAGSRPPPWFVGTVRMVVNGMRGNNDTRACYPTRKALRDRLKKVQRGAELLARIQRGLSAQRRAICSGGAFAGFPGLTSRRSMCWPMWCRSWRIVWHLRLQSGTAKVATRLSKSRCPFPHEQCAGLVTWGWHNLRHTRPPHTSEEIAQSVRGSVAGRRFSPPSLR